MSLIKLPPIQTVRLTEHWHVAKDGDPAGLELYERHYSCYHYKDNRIRKLFAGPGEKLVLLTEQGDALWVWRRFIENQETEPRGINCSVFRNESQIQSSQLRREADRIAWCRWPGQRLYTYVHPGKIKSANPGYCFKVGDDGYRYVRTTPGGLHELERLPP